MTQSSVLGLPRGFLDLSGADAAGADIDPLHRGTDLHANALKIRQPATAGNVVGVADPVTENRCLPADFTHLGHGNSSNNAKGVDCNDRPVFVQPEGPSGRPNARIRFTYLFPVELTPQIKRCNFASPFNLWKPLEPSEK